MLSGGAYPEVEAAVAASCADPMRTLVKPRAISDAAPLMRLRRGLRAARINLDLILLTRQPEIVWSILVLLLMLLWITRSRLIWLHHPGSDWNSSEWMISYGAGFVRRGLGGSALLFLIRHTHLSFFTVWVGLTAAIYAAICVWFVRAMGRLRGPAVWRAALLFNPLFVLFGALSGTFLRKDMLFVGAAIAHVEFARKLRMSRSRRLLASYLAFFAVTSTVLALLHEGDFLFLWLAINLLILWRSLVPFEPRRAVAALLVAFTVGPSLVAAGAAIVRHGDAAISRVIRESWTAEMPRAYRSEPDSPPEVRYLGESLHDELRLPRQTAWQFPLFLCSFLLLGTAAVLAFPVLVPGSTMRRTALLLCLPVVVGLPMAVVMMDWGRWFACLACCTLPALLHPSLVWADPPAAGAFAEPVPDRLGRARRFIEAHPVVFTLALVCCPMPPWPCPNPFLAYNPFYLLLFLLHLLHTG